VTLFLTGCTDPASNSRARDILDSDVTVNQTVMANAADAANTCQGKTSGQPCQIANKVKATPMSLSGVSTFETDLAG
jgi:hypothetical protein